MRKMGRPERDPPPYPGHLPPTEKEVSLENLSACTRQEPQGQEQLLKVDVDLDSSIVKKLSGQLKRSKTSKLPQPREYENVKSNELLHSLKNPFRKYMEVGNGKTNKLRPDRTNTSVPSSSNIRIGSNLAGLFIRKDAPNKRPLPPIPSPKINSNSSSISSNGGCINSNYSSTNSSRSNLSAGHTIQPTGVSRTIRQQPTSSTSTFTITATTATATTTATTTTNIQADRKKIPIPLNNRILKMRQKFQDGRECFSADNTRPTTPINEKTLSNPDLTEEKNEPDVNNSCKPVTVSAPVTATLAETTTTTITSINSSQIPCQNEDGKEKPPIENQPPSNFTAKTARIIKNLSLENRSLREQLNVSHTKLTQFRHLETELTRIKESYEQLTIQTKKREMLECTVRKKLEDDNKDLRNKIDDLRRTNTNYQLQKKDAIISHLLSQNQKHCSDKERLQMQLAQCSGDFVLKLMRQIETRDKKIQELSQRINSNNNSSSSSSRRNNNLMVNEDIDVDLDLDNDDDELEQRQLVDEASNLNFSQTLDDWS